MCSFVLHAFVYEEWQKKRKTFPFLSMLGKQQLVLTMLIIIKLAKKRAYVHTGLFVLRSIGAKEKKNGGEFVQFT